MLEIFNLLNLITLLTLILFIVIKHDLLTYLLLTEFIWVLFYVISVVIGIQFDIMYLVSLSLLLLILAGLEFSLGLLFFYFF